MENTHKSRFSSNDLLQDVVIGALFAGVGVFLGWFAGYMFDVTDTSLLRVIGGIAGLAYSRHMLKTVSNLRIGS